MRNWPPPSSASFSGVLPPLHPQTQHEFTFENCNKILHAVQTWAPSILREAPDEHRVAEQLELQEVADLLLSWREQLGLATGQLCRIDSRFGQFTYDAKKLLQAVLLSKSLRNKSALQKAVELSIEIAVPKLMGGVLIESLQGQLAPDTLRIPSAATVAKHELSLDMAIVGLTRKMSAQTPGYWLRYGWSDASPLAGFDWLWSQEHWIPSHRVLDVMLAVHSSFPSLPPPHPVNVTNQNTCHLRTNSILQFFQMYRLPLFCPSGLQHRAETFAELLDEEDELDEDTIMQPAQEWLPWLECILQNIHFHINPPSALASGRRHAEDKARTLLYTWALQSDRSVALETIASGFVSHTSDLGVESGLPTLMCKRPLEGLLPEWMSESSLQVPRHVVEDEVDIDDLLTGRTWGFL